MASNNAEGGTNGTTVTTANSGGTSGDAWQTVTIGTGSALTFDNAHAAHGSLSYKFANAASAVSNVQWSTTVGTQSTIYGRIYLFISSLSNNIVIFQPLNGATSCGQLKFATTGSVFFANAIGTTLGTIPTLASLGSWVRIEFQLSFSTTTGSGRIDLYNAPDSFTPTDSITFSGANLGAANATIYKLGVVQTLGAAGAQTIWMDSVVVNATGFPGADVTITPYNSTLQMLGVG